MSDGLETPGGDSLANSNGVNSSALKSLLRMNGMRRAYMYVHTTNVNSSIANTGVNIASWFMSFAALRYQPCSLQSLRM